MVSGRVFGYLNYAYPSTYTECYEYYNSFKMRVRKVDDKIVDIIHPNFCFVTRLEIIKDCGRVYYNIGEGSWVYSTVRDSRRFLSNGQRTESWYIVKKNPVRIYDVSVTLRDPREGDDLSKCRFDGKKIKEITYMNGGNQVVRAMLKDDRTFVTDRLKLMVDDSEGDTYRVPTLVGYTSADNKCFIPVTNVEYMSTTEIALNIGKVDTYTEPRFRNQLARTIEEYQTVGMRRCKKQLLHRTFHGYCSKGNIVIVPNNMVEMDYIPSMKQLPRSFIGVSNELAVSREQMETVSASLEEIRDTCSYIEIMPMSEINSFVDVEDEFDTEL
jgi:hypothetical protein